MIGFDLKIDKSKIEKDLWNLIKVSISKAPLEVSGFEVTVDLVNVPSLNIIDKLISTRLPLAVKFKKNAALFTVQGHGQLMVQLETLFDINPQFQLSTKSTLQAHSWIEKPVIDVGSLDIPVEKLFDMVINHYDEMMTSIIDKSIKDNVNLPSIIKSSVKHLQSKIAQFDFEGIHLFAQPSELILEPLDTDSQFFIAKGAIRAEVAFGNHNPLEDTGTTLRWVESLLSDNITFVHLNIPEEIIAKWMVDFVNKQQYGGENLECDACTVDFDKQYLNVQLDLVKPISGVVKLKGLPRYSEADYKLHLDQLDVDLKASNFIYKLTAPLVNKFLESSIKDKLPIAVDEMIKTQLSKHFTGSTSIDGISFTHHISSVVLSSMKFNDEGLSVIIKVNEGEVSITT